MGHPAQRRRVRRVPRPAPPLALGGRHLRRRLVRGPRLVAAGARRRPAPTTTSSARSWPRPGRRRGVHRPPGHPSSTAASAPCSACPSSASASAASTTSSTAHLNFLVTAQTPVIRGGIFAAGGTVRINWYPTESSSFTVGFAIPLGDHRTGRGRPASEYRRRRGEVPHAQTLRHSATRPSTPCSTRCATSAEWVRRVTVPFLDQDGRTSPSPRQRNAAYLRSCGPTSPCAAPSRRCASSTPSWIAPSRWRRAATAAGRQLAREARAILLDEVILPYNGLLGRKQRRDALVDLVIAARGRFGGSVAAAGLVPGDAVEHGALRLPAAHGASSRPSADRAAKEWDDPRLVWLPLQYALLPEDHDTQAELDALVERATHVDFTNGNRIRYLANLQFHWELMRSIEPAQELSRPADPRLPGRHARRAARLGLVRAGPRLPQHPGRAGRGVRQHADPADLLHLPRPALLRDSRKSPDPG